ncbi:hypothetical protein IWW57_001676 [Coemansia sp. S610]|nr:hypothetical protein GGI06_001949 [Coemansia sp. S85]KAJ2029536.1 hypothetical protein IWW57_001676 [Coemansia sp. S610]KAJ2411729.1 hypothetical protein GGI10_004101 [Coemansia sp. RSA 2530]KAJ2696760.1 hypothetical protein H4218_004391 [Coemansia sp. IMI 209128]
MAQPILSPLQLLPLHVVKLIVDHVVGSSRLRYDGVQAKLRVYRELLRPLHSVSHNFRDIALSYYWKTLKINLTNKDFGDSHGYDPPLGVTDTLFHLADHFGYPTCHLAKDVTIFLDERAVFSGKALEMLCVGDYASCPFPAARKVSFIFIDDSMEEEGDDDDDDDLAIDLAKAEANTRAFVKRIKQMAPSVSEIRIKLPDCDDFSSAVSQPLSDLVSQLFEFASCIDYNFESYDADPLHLRLDTTDSLTHIRYKSEASRGNVDEFIQLAKRNALTLQSLLLEDESGFDVLSLVRNDDGRCVTYPCLLSLYLYAFNFGREMLGRPIFRGTAPFPILRRLRILLDSPFDDDTFFRGNAATLEQLSFYLDMRSVSMLRKYQVFVPDSHPKLQAVQLSLTVDFGLESFASPAEAMEFIHTIGSGAAVLEYNVEREVDIFSSLDNHACIQVLILRTLPLELATVLNLIKSLPLLSDLHTGMPSLGPMPDGVTMDALPEYVVSQYAPMGERFRCWHFYNGHSRHCNDLETYVTCVLMLALACPNFDYAVPPSGIRNLFMERLRKEMTSDRFKPYAPRLRRLLFLGWNAKND